MTDAEGFSGLAYVSGICFLLLASLTWLRQQSHRLPYPPGPSGLPVLGNTLQMPHERQWLQYVEWGRKYGKIIHLSMLGHSMIILNSADVIVELLEKRSKLYSDRPTIPLAGEMIGYDQYIALEHYGSRQTEGRKLITGALSVRNMPKLHQIEESKVVHLMSRLIARPVEFRLHLRWFVAAVAFEYTHAYQVEDCDDYFVRLAERVNNDFNTVVKPGKYLVDIFPFLKHIPDWMPGTKFKAVAKEARERVQRLADETFEIVQTRVADGTARASFTADLIESNPERTPEEEDIFKTTSMTFYAAGTDTTVSTLESFFLIMTLHPEIQRKAQAEVDHVIGLDRLPKVSDRPRLPYVEGLIKEAFRWNPVFPLALPHYLNQDDVYEGYHIPANSTVIANSWAILHDSSLYPQPFEVLPERYLQQEHGLNPDPKSFAFGYGRRVCPGQPLADDLVFIVAITILATLNISQPIGADGLPVKPDVSYTGVALSHPGPFECAIAARSVEAEHQIIHAASC
uniref:Cytochrome P450 n=1 Tax=Rhodonia placenta TaxID=104341 RepID=F1SYA1_9APHY|nr:cytochrome P450 [Postia placenta]